VITCLLFGLVPAMRATHLEPAAVIRGAGRARLPGGNDSACGERWWHPGRLVTGATRGRAPVCRSLPKPAGRDAGFGLKVCGCQSRSPAADYSKERLPVVYRELQERLSTQLGVLSVAQVNFTPISGSGWNNNIGPDGTVAGGSGKESYFNRVGPGYFRTMGTPVIAGREFNEGDTLSSPQVAIVNELFAAKFFKVPTLLATFPS
jgi:hypothetical protein